MEEGSDGVQNRGAAPEPRSYPGGSKKRGIDVRFIAATNADIEEHLQSGKLRRDLYYRIAGTRVTVPALRYRREDIPGLVECYLRRAVTTTCRRISGITTAALAALADSPWPGNVRELANTVERLVADCPERQAIDAAMVEACLSSAQLETASSRPQARDRKLETASSRPQCKRLLLTTSTCLAALPPSSGS